jgi:hypothetical protein
VLIEGSKTAMTDSQGRYSIVGLRPGEYRVKFTLEGFNTTLREGVDLPANFTATVNATMSVGSLQETVTVSGASPVVDVHQTQRVEVLDRTELDALTTGRNIWSQATLVAGVVMAGTDVGGAQGVDDVALEAHGARSTETQTFVDGLNVNTMGWNGMGNNWYSEQMYNDLSIQTSGGAAESLSGGMQVNMIPKDGGNRFAGTGYAGGTAGAWQSDNFSDELKAKGLASVDKVDRIFDYNASVGGPIVKDRLWFYHTSRYWGLYAPLANVFEDDGSPYSQHSSVFSPVSRLTGQLTRRDKITLHLDLQFPRTGPTLTPSYPLVINSVGADPETARQTGKHSFWVGQTKWSSARSNRLLLEAGYSASSTLLRLDAPPGVVAPVGTPEWFSMTQKQDLDRGVTWNSTGQTGIHSFRNLIHGSATYVTGSHNAKLGVTSSWGKFTQKFGFGTNGHLTQQYRSGAPTSVLVYNYPVFQDPRVKYELATFAQDSWTIRRLTINGGVRLDWLNAYDNPQTAPAGRFVPLRQFPEVDDVPDWGPDVSPRLALAYDLFGSAKTALKFSVGKFMNVFTTDYALRFNPMAIAATSLPWSDRDLLGATLGTNGDDIAQENEFDIRRLPSNFGERQLERLDADLKREYNVETSVSVQHELVRGVSVSAGWFHRTYHRAVAADNLLREPGDYRPVEVVSPYNGELFTIYDLKDPAKLSQVDTVVRNVTGDSHKEVYDGFEFSMHGRLPNGGLVVTSWTMQHTIRKTCEAGTDDPNGLRFCDRFNLPAMYNGVPYRHPFKVSVNYPLPYGIQATGTFTSVPGRPNDDFIRIDEVLPINWLITPGTRYTAQNCENRSCTAGALVVPGMVLPTLTVPLAPAGTERSLPVTNLLALGATRIFRNGRVSYKPSADVFNVLNADTVLQEASANYGTPAYGVPSRVLTGRLLRLSMKVEW